MLYVKFARKSSQFLFSFTPKKKKSSGPGVDLKKNPATFKFYLEGYGQMFN